MLYSVLNFGTGMQNISIAIVVITLLYPYGCLNKNGLQITKEKS
jgi:hypothetical protein